MMRRPAPGWVAAAALAWGGCGGRDDARADASLAVLRAEVQALSDAAAARSGDVPWLRDVHEDSAHVTLGVRVGTLGELLSAAASRYLDDVRLHLRLDVVVRAGDEVRVRVGPLSASAGRWDLAVTVQRVDATLRAGAIEIAPGDSSRIDLLVPVHVSDASGTALIDFTWNASRVANVVCGDFSVHEPFTGYVRSRTYAMHGHIEVVAEHGGMTARPVLRDRIFVSPQPTEESWARLRDILREQDRIFNCGLALSPERMETMLADLLTRGFRFSLPASVLRPIPLPGTVLNEVSVAGRRVAVAVLPQPPRLAEGRLWLRAAVHPSAIEPTIAAHVQPR